MSLLSKNRIIIVINYTVQLTNCQLTFKSDIVSYYRIKKTDQYNLVST